MENIVNEVENMEQDMDLNEPVRGLSDLQRQGVWYFGRTDSGDRRRNPAVQNTAWRKRQTD